jgi:hypothetical protein
MDFQTTGQCSIGTFDCSGEEIRNILQIQFDERQYLPWSVYNKETVSFGTWDRKTSKWSCTVTDSRAQVFAKLKPETPQAIADICGVPVEELPFFLQKYYVHYPYTGNHILTRIDPLDRLKNPWNELELHVIVAMSKSAFHKGRKELGLIRFNEWELIRAYRD